MVCQTGSVPGEDSLTETETVLIDESWYFNDFIQNSNSEYFGAINSLKSNVAGINEERKIFHTNIIGFDNPVKVTPVSLEKKINEDSVLPGDSGLEYLKKLESFFIELDIAKDKYKEYYTNVKKHASLIEQQFLLDNSGNENINTQKKLYDFVQVLPVEAFGIKKDLYELGIYFKETDSEIFRTFLAAVYTMSIPYIMERSADLIDSILIKNPEDIILSEKLFANRIFYFGRIDELFFETIKASEALWFLSEMSITQPYLNYAADKGFNVEELKGYALDSIGNVTAIFNSLSEFQLYCISSSDYPMAFGLNFLYNTIYCLKKLESDFEAIFPYIEIQEGSSLKSLDYFFNSVEKRDNYTTEFQDPGILSVDFLEGYKDALSCQNELNNGFDISLCDLISSPEVFYIINNSGLFTDLKQYYYSNFNNLFPSDSEDYKLSFLKKLSEKFSVFKTAASRCGISPFYFITNEQYFRLEFLEEKNYNPGYFGLYDIERLSYLISQIDDALVILNSTGQRMLDIIYERSFFK